MAKVSMTFEGLPDYRLRLLGLPDELLREAEPIVRRAAETTFREAYAAYPHVTGNLKEGLRLEDESVGLRAVYTVVNRAKHAYIYEYGTELRETKLGYKRGRMTPRPTLMRIGPREGYAMQLVVGDLVRQKGFLVDGDR